MGGSEGTRTPDPLHAMQVRYQLRHRPRSCCFRTGQFPGGTIEAYTMRTPGDEIVAATRARRDQAVWSTGSSSVMVGQSDQRRSSE